MNTQDLVLYENITECLTLKGVAEKKGRNTTEADLGVIQDAAMVVDGKSNTIVWVGAQKELPQQYQEINNIFSGEGEVWLPELIECHTHLVHAGTRSHDYALRCKGKTYQEVAAETGGILSTIIPTREADPEELIESAQSELDRFQRYGVGTIEIKSGYGLSWESELKILQVIAELKTQESVTIVPTFMPAHATPPEFRGKTDEYVDLICQEWIPEVAKRKLAVFFDVFVEEGYFTAAQARKLCSTAREHGMKIKLHSDQFKDIGGTPLGLELGATSLDHLENISAENIKKLGQSDTVAVLCPGASLFMGTPPPPARKLIDAGARVAISTDYNPGTCPSRNLPLMTTIACSQLKLTIPEAIAAVTYNAAAALGLEKDLGSLTPGKHFRSCQLKGGSYEVLPYCFGELD